MSSGSFRRGRPAVRRDETMKKVVAEKRREFDFSRGKRGPVILPDPGKTKISIRMDKAIEDIGYDHIDIFDHVVMGHPIAGRPPGPYNAAMPILEPFITLGYLAAVTTRVTLGTEVLVLPQRQPTLVAKQVSTLDTLSGGRVRLGVGVGWQESEYEALGEDFHTRGARMDEAIAVLRACWGDAQVDVSEK